MIREVCLKVGMMDSFTEDKLFYVEMCVEQEETLGLMAQIVLQMWGGGRAVKSFGERGRCWKGGSKLSWFEAML